ncbi:MAG: DUF1553 domain-containing protein [Lentisphaerae bacterium]|nr:DUF1553 domain-containing protein [Lentisphaerota bacterium]
MKFCKPAVFLAATAILSLFSQDVYLKKAPPAPISDFDIFLYRYWKQQKVTPANEASDCVMVRRLYIDLAGRVPTPQEALDYINCRQKRKQQLLVQELLESEEHAMFMTMRLGDELRIKSEFPINLWPNAAFLYSRTIFDAIRTNMPFDAFAQMLICADGSNFRNGYVNFYRAVPVKNSIETANAFAGFLFGKKLQELPAAEQKRLIDTFAHIRFKSTREWKEEIVYSTVPFSAGSDPRIEFARESVNSPEFAEAAVRRVWRWIFGNCEVDKAIIERLAADFRDKDFDLRALLYEICTSTAYRVGSISEGDYTQKLKYAAIYPVRRLDAEVLADSIAQITGVPYTYSSVIPEPFSYYHGRAAALPDGSITDRFLLLFGRPSRDSGAWEERKNTITADQRLYLFNSADINSRLQKLLWQKLKKEKDKFNALFLLFYSRPPTGEEREIFNTMGKKVKSWKLLARMPWILLNSREFLYQH